MELLIFSALSVMTIVPAVLVVSFRNVFHSALMLIVSLLGVAGLYAMMAADFLFAVQLLVYAGGVMVILLFVVMLSGSPKDWAGVQINEKAWGAGLFSLLFVVVLLTTVLEWPLGNTPAQQPLTTTGQLGQLLLSDMILPFEIISLVLVVALVGAIYFSKKRTS